MPKLPRLVGLATTNPGKRRDFDDLCAPFGLKFEAAPDDFEVEECGTSFAANAQLKAEALMRRLNMACVADDSGLIVDALGGAPGLYSARYSGETRPDRRDSANQALLLRRLTHVDAPLRTARFVCSIAYVAPGSAPSTFAGALAGRIATTPMGDGGFGYDAVFIPENQTQSMAQLPPHVRIRISHRAQAMAKLAAFLADRHGS